MKNTINLANRKNRINRINRINLVNLNLQRKKSWGGLIGGGLRRWDEMPPELLLQIFCRVPIRFLFIFIVHVCKSWRSSVFDFIFPSNGILDLKRMDTLSNGRSQRYLDFVQILLDERPKTLWHTITLPRYFILKEHAVIYIAQRSPCVRILDVETVGQFSSVQKALPYWRHLEKFTCQISRREISSFASELGYYCMNISYLGLVGVIGVKQASAIVKTLPNLTCLSLEKCALSVDALLILDGHEKIAEVNLEHTLIVDEQFLECFGASVFNKTWPTIYLRTTAKKWTEEICKKVSGAKKYFRCREKLCPECSWAYSL
ncbi:hypothetical protein AQUCO_01000114v1 [Aquilegia coerulea]|uniref:F-box domain-containing protein n=1 Tax=Aquilegia coerulea TaxID=218851 RepID=A0A2G5E8C1_AQUCA|nr:hypothetical protein AQUCO_01000114v1 [Aquilegia coerulea]PIA52007.1 hypothetical protein AQUCO_01000114v1 [Aquilegia coerulea]